MEDIEQLIKRLNITLRLESIAEEELRKASYILIRHGYSQYNYRD